MDDRIKKVMAAVFQMDASQIDEGSSLDTIENWDSLKHMNLIIALEEEFMIQFDDSEVMGLLSFKLIRMVIQEKATG